MEKKNIDKAHEYVIFIKLTTENELRDIYETFQVTVTKNLTLR
jgi:hypothetical protein